MKKYILIMVAFIFTLSSCEKETEGVSKETQFATLTLKGEQYSSIVVGQSFTDPGVEAKEGETVLEVTTAGQVDSSKPGIYTLVYSALNQDGFPGSATRTVAVIPAAENAGIDLSGNYKRGAVSAVVTKYAPGFYRLSDVFGGSIIPIYFLTSGDGKNLIVPESALSGFGPVVGTGVVTVDGSLDFKISLLAQNASFQNITRIWAKN